MLFQRTFRAFVAEGDAAFLFDFLLSLCNVKSVCQVLTIDNCNDTITLVFGPEGGLSKKEEDLIESNHFTKTSLGNDVLRTETVPLMIASIRKYLKESV